MNKLLILQIITCLCLCSTLRSLRNPVATFNLTSSDPNKKVAKYTIQAKAGSRITLKLEGNITTGFSWYLMNKSQLNTRLISVDNLLAWGAGVFRPLSNLQGSSGFFYFECSLKGVGDQVLELVYKRIWETTAAKRYSVKIHMIRWNFNL
jgi:predicted secreted protein